MITISKFRWEFFILGFILAGTAQAEYDKWLGLNFSAERSVYDAEKPEVVEKNKIYYSKVGMRIERDEGQENSVSIVNIQQQKCWFIQPDKKIYYEVAFHPETKKCDSLDLAGFKPETRSLGVFSPRPCFGFKSMKILGEEYVIGRRTAKWQCIDKGGTPVVQWFDSTLHMVVREARNNQVTEGNKIVISRTIQYDQLLPPPGYALKH